ncbi:hypothetical protein GCM10009691_26580 [Brevibacterium picturae]|uniref:Uncharacterized protein n=1 Tax=Brevibacterium picturae TaxID=260553 RepID=A0ABN2C0V1_9MICO
MGTGSYECSSSSGTDDSSDDESEDPDGFVGSEVPDDSEDPDGCEGWPAESPAPCDPSASEVAEDPGVTSTGVRSGGSG